MGCTVDCLPYVCTFQRHCKEHHTIVKNIILLCYETLLLLYENEGTPFLSKSCKLEIYCRLCKHVCMQLIFRICACSVANSNWYHVYLWPTVDGFAVLNQHMRTTKVNTMNFSCIANADQLGALFQNTPAARKFQGRDHVHSLLLFHMHIHMAAPQSNPNDSGHTENECCEAAYTQDTCRTIAAYSRAIFENYPYPLVDLFSFPTATIKKYLISGIQPTSADYIEDFCWTPPLPFCLGSEVSGTIRSFIKQVKTVMQT